MSYAERPPISTVTGREQSCSETARRCGGGALWIAGVLGARDGRRGARRPLDPDCVEPFGTCRRAQIPTARWARKTCGRPQAFFVDEKGVEVSVICLVPPFPK